MHTEGLSRRYRRTDESIDRPGSMTLLGTTITVVVPGSHLMASLVGPRDEYVRQIEQAFPAVNVSVRGNEISLSGDGADDVGKLFEELVLVLQRGQHLDPPMVTRAIDMMQQHESPSRVLTDDILRATKGRSVRPKSAGQKRYIDAIRENIITFGLGPAGTGKSWLAVAMAVQALQTKQVQRIILTRPAV